MTARSVRGAAALLMLACGSCSSMHERARASAAEVTATARLCAPYVAAEGGARALLDLEHDVEPRLRFLLGDAAVVWPSAHSEIERDADAVAGARGRASSLGALRARVDELLALRASPPCQVPDGEGAARAIVACIDEQRRASWAPSGQGLRDEIVARALSLRGDVAAQAEAGRKLASQLSAAVAAVAPAQGSDAARSRLAAHDMRVDALRKAGAAVAASAEAATVIDAGARVDEQVRVIERLALQWASETRASGGELEAVIRLVGRARRHRTLARTAASAARSLSGAGALPALLSKGEGRLVARLALRSLRSVVADLHHRIERLDDKVYGAITVTSFVAGDPVGKVIDEALEGVGQASAEVLASLGVSPEALLQEGCSALVSGSPDASLVRIDALYAAIARASRAPQVAPRGAEFTSETYRAAAMTEWAFELDEEVSRGLDVGARPAPSQALRDRVFDELRGRPDLLAKGAGASDLALSRELRATATLRVEVQGRADIDTSGLARQIDALGDVAGRIEKSNDRVVRELQRSQGTMLDAQVIGTMCTILHENPLLASLGISARCVERAPVLPVGALELGAVPSSRRGLFPKGVFHLDARARVSAAEREQLESTRAGVEYMARAMLRAAHDRPSLAFSVRVEGFASAVQLRCPDLKKKLADINGDPQFGGLPVCSDAQKATCYAPVGDGVAVTLDGERLGECAARDGDANPLLAVLRAQAVTQVLRRQLCGAGAPRCTARDPDPLRFRVDPDRSLPSRGSGGDENQRFRLYVEPISP